MGTGKGKGAKTQRQERASRAEHARLEHAARDRRHRLLIWGSVVAVIGVLASLTGYTIVSESAGKSLSAVKSFKVVSKHVTTPVKYPHKPPTGGPHDGTWLNCAAYDMPVPAENAVHSLEHGAVWVTYRPDLPKDQVDALKANMGDPYDILSPYPGLPAPVVASAWGKQLRLTGPDDKRLTEFLQTYRKGKQAPEAGASCSGGTDGTNRPGTEVPAPPGQVPAPPTGVPAPPTSES